MTTAHKTLALKKTTQTGKAVEVYAISPRDYEVILDGVSGGTVCGPYMAVVKNGGGVIKPTVINWGSKIVMLTAAEAKTIEAAGDALAVKVAPVADAETRRALCATYGGLLDERDARRDRAWDRGDEAGAFDTDAGLNDRIAAASQAVADFDAAHPEVIAKIKSDRAESTERNMWM